MILKIIAVCIVTVIAFFMYCLMVTAKRADETLNEIWEQKQEKETGDSNE